MGGHSAWRKRVARGELAIQSGGAIARHRPRWGRKGEDLKLNRKGNIAGGNPKKMKKKKRSTGSKVNQQDGQQDEPGKRHIQNLSENNINPMRILIIAAASIVGLSFLAILRYLMNS